MGLSYTTKFIIFKEISHSMSPSLQSIFNQCVGDCSWPTNSKWKMGEWTPVFKKGERQQGLKLTNRRQLAIKYKFLVARGQIVVTKNSPSLFSNKS